MPAALPPLTLVLGGARSGKSRFAEGLATGSGLARRYLATAQAFDAEMQARIAQHRADRAEGWELLEAPLDLTPALLSAGPDSVTLVDCLTLWLSNQMLAGHDPETAAEELLATLAACRGPAILVSNEVGSGIVPENALARAFRDAQGRLNQRLAARADLAVLVVAGLPLVLKGRLP